MEAHVDQLIQEKIKGENSVTLYTPQDFGTVRPRKLEKVLQEKLGDRYSVHWRQHDFLGNGRKLNTIDIYKRYSL